MSKQAATVAVILATVEILVSLALPIFWAIGG